MLWKGRLGPLAQAGGSCIRLDRIQVTLDLAQPVVKIATTHCSTSLVAVVDVGGKLAEFIGIDARPREGIRHPLSAQEADNLRLTR